MSFFDRVEKVLAGPMASLANQPYIKAIRDGMVSTIPLTIVGSLFLILAFPPVPAAWKESWPLFKWIGQNIFNILLPFRVTMGLIGVFAIYNTAYSLAKQYKLDGVSGGTLALVGYFLTVLPKMAVVAPTPDQLKAGVAAKDLASLGFALPMANLGAQGLFGGFLVAFLAVEVLRFFVSRGFIIKMPEGVPESVSKSFAALLPTFALVTIISIFTIFLGIDIHAIIYKVFAPMSKFLNGPFGVVLTVFLITLLWSAGLHGVSVIGSLARPIWVELLNQNAEAMANKAAVLPNIAPEPFYQWFVWIGGSGCTIGLLLLMVLRAKSAHLKALGKTALIPGLFNINEPIIFGAPIMLNPYLVIPFMLGPVVIAITTYIAMAMNLVGRPAILAPWTFPAPFGAFLSTNGSIGAVILVFVNIAITTLIYYPFFRAYDKKLYSEEQAASPASEYNL